MSSSVEDYRDSFLKIKPKTIFWGIVAIAIVLACTAVIIFFCYLTVCFLDREPPLKNVVYTAKDAKIGGTTNVTIKGYRNRICAYKFTKMVTDSKGKIVYLDEGGRLTNGPIREIDVTDEYPIAANAAPGKAVMHLYAYWQCPGNLIHKLMPIFKEYSDTLELSSLEGVKDLSDLDEGRAKEELDKELAAAKTYKEQQQEMLSNFKK